MIDAKVGLINLMNPFTKIYQSSIYALKEIGKPNIECHIFIFSIIYSWQFLLYGPSRILQKKKSRIFKNPIRSPFNKDYK